jgi:glycosyltransferase involved in cell wall biosynthesis
MTPAASDANRLRVLVLATWYPSPRRPADGVFVRETARALARRHDVAVVFAEPAPAGARPARSDRVEDGVRTVRLAFRPLPTARASLPLRLLAFRLGLEHLRATGFRPDVLHAHVYLAGAAAVALGRRAGAPVVVSEHLGAFVGGTVGPAQLGLARAVYERADLTCPVSDDLGRRLAAVAPRARLRTMGNVVDTDLFRPADRRADGPPRLAAVGALIPRKAFDQLLHALAALREQAPVTLEIAGDGPSRGALEALAARLGLREAVTFLGAQDRAGVAAVLRRADVLVLPSLIENQPVVLLEAQACGVPVVATRVGGVGEVVDAAAGRLVAPRDPGALARAIAAVLADPGAYDPVALAARARARFGHDAVAARWDGVYRELRREREGALRDAA